MISRRSVLGAGVAFGVGLGMSACAPNGGSGSTHSAASQESPSQQTPLSSIPPNQPRSFDAEWEPHQQTFMSWPTRAVWGRDARYVQEDIANLAQTIARFEKVVLLASPEDVTDAQQQCGGSVTVQALGVNDLWARDTVPVFVESAGKVAGVDFNFNGWGNKQEHDQDGKVAAELLTATGIPKVATWLVAEGGSLESDGAGTLLVTESSLLNDNRNPGKSREELETELKTVLGVQKVIWAKGVYGQDITDAHIDSLVRYAAPGKVFLDVPGPGSPDDVWAQASQQARTVLQENTDARGKPFEILELPQPDFGKIRGRGKDFLATYANFYILNGAVILPEFGDRAADDKARGLLAEHFLSRQIVTVSIDTIASGGGGVHCATHELPASS